MSHYRYSQEMEGGGERGISRDVYFTAPKVWEGGIFRDVYFPAPKIWEGAFLGVSTSLFPRSISAYYYNLACFEKFYSLTFGVFFFAYFNIWHIIRI